MVMDTFGDGFGNGKLYLFDSKHYYHKYAPNCDENPITIEYCFDPNTMDEGHKLTASIHGYSLHHKWEVKRI
jgi:hypothetical protein